MAIPKLNDYALPRIDDLPVNKVNWQFMPKRAALLIHDMQEYFLNFWQPDSPLINQMVKNIVALRAFCKAQGIPVYYTAQPKQQDVEDRALLNDMWGPGLTRHPEQQAIIDALAPDADDIQLVKWRYSAFHRSSLQQMLAEQQRDQLIICGVYAHIGCLTTAVDAFMRNIKPFMVADGVADFSHNDHLMALNYVARCCGYVANTEDLLSAKKGLKEALLQQILPYLDDVDGAIEDDENLIDYGLDSVRIMELAARWRKENPKIDFIALAKEPTLNAWCELLEEAV